MLSQAENEYLCRIGPGTPMGTLLRRFWMPALISTEFPEPDCPPIRMRLLGEDLIAFRDSTGRVGMIQNNCPHRGASLFFGRNEESGLRCVYHGWKFDTTGACVDMPNEPAESDFKHKVTATAYPTQEAGGVVWAYLARPRNVRRCHARSGRSFQRSSASSVATFRRTTGSRVSKAASTPATCRFCTARLPRTGATTPARTPTFSRSIRHRSSAWSKRILA